MNTVIGVDLGSRTTKIIQLVDGEIRHREIFDTGHDPLPKVRQSLSRLDADRIVATGYGRHLVCEHFGSNRVTEIKASGRGARHLFPLCRTILDMGGQDCKVIYLDSGGKTVDFEMNDRCAAGTGRFLENMARVFDVDIDEFVQIALRAEKHITINSMCTVFAESEVVSLITSGRSKEEIALGLHIAITGRLNAMMRKFPLEDDIVFVGGGAKNDCLHKILEQHLQRPLLRPDDPRLTIALGAALLGYE